MKTWKEKWKSYVMLQGLILLYSLSSVCSKCASQQEFLSLKFILFYGAVILLLGVYAILWQQILKKIPLVTAYANKAVTVIWGLIWGLLLFDEQINRYKVCGCIIIIIGVYLVVCEQGDES